MHHLLRYRCVLTASVTIIYPTYMTGVVNSFIICLYSISSIPDSNTRASWRSSCHKGKVLHSGWVFGTSRSFLSPYWSHFFQCFVRELYYITHNIYSMYDARMLTWRHFCVRCRESAQPVVTDGITVTPTSPARWTRKTSAVSSVTVGTSFSGCTCGSTSSCDGQQPHVLHSPHPPQAPPTWPSPTIVQTARKGPPLPNHLTHVPFSVCPIKNVFFFFLFEKLSQDRFTKYHPGLTEAPSRTFALSRSEPLPFLSVPD